MKRYFQLILALLCPYFSPLLSQETHSHVFPSDSTAHCFDPEAFEEKIKHKPEECVDISQLDLSLSAECEPLTTVGGCVNVLSGHFFQIEKDLISNTIEPLDVIRYYDSGSSSESFLGYGFGSSFPLWASDTQQGARHTYIMISERDGFLLPYRNKEGESSKFCWIDPRVLKKGYTNLSRAAISGHTNCVNWQASFQISPDLPGWTLQLGDGTKRMYSKRVDIPKEQQARMNFPTEARVIS